LGVYEHGSQAAEKLVITSPPPEMELRLIFGYFRVGPRISWGYGPLYGFLQDGAPPVISGFINHNNPYYSYIYHKATYKAT